MAKLVCLSRQGYISIARSLINQNSLKNGTIFQKSQEADGKISIFLVPLQFVDLQMTVCQVQCKYYYVLT